MHHERSEELQRQRGGHSGEMEIKGKRRAEKRLKLRVRFKVKGCSSPLETGDWRWWILRCFILTPPSPELSSLFNVIFFRGSDSQTLFHAPFTEHSLSQASRDGNYLDCRIPAPKQVENEAPHQLHQCCSKGQSYSYKTTDITLRDGFCHCVWDYVQAGHLKNE